MKKALILDYWSELNRGDGAMQVAITELIEKRFNFKVILDYGINQYKDIIPEIDHSNIERDQFLPGNKYTFYTITKDYFLPDKYLHILKFLMNLFLYFFSYFCIKTGLTFLLPRFTKNILKAIQDSDILIWNGRNFRSNSKIREIPEFFDLLNTVLIACLYKKRMICYGVSVWPLKTKFSERLLNYTFGKCEVVYARESFSFKYLSELGHKNIELIPDLSFYTLLRSEFPIQKFSFSQDNFNIGLVLKSWSVEGKEAMKKYIDAHIDFFKYLKTDNQTLKVHIISQVPMKKESTDLVRSEVCKRFEEFGIQYEVLNGTYNISELQFIYGMMEFTISTRMHGCIFSLSKNKRIIPISYDTGAKWFILKDLGVEEVIPISEVTGERLISYYQNIDKFVDLNLISEKMNEGAERIEGFFTI